MAAAREWFDVVPAVPAGVGRWRWLAGSAVQLLVNALVDTFLERATGVVSSRPARYRGELRVRGGRREKRIRD